MQRVPVYTFDQVEALLKKLDDYMIDLAANHPDKWQERKESYFAIMDAIEEKGVDELKIILSQTAEKFKSKSMITIWQQYADILHALSETITVNPSWIYQVHIRLEGNKRTNFFWIYESIIKRFLQYIETYSPLIKNMDTGEQHKLKQKKVEIAHCVTSLSAAKLGINIYHLDRFVRLQKNEIIDAIKKIAISYFFLEEEHNKALAQEKGVGKSGELGRLLTELKTHIMQYYPWILSDENVIKLKNTLSTIDETLFGTHLETHGRNLDRTSISNQLRLACIGKKRTFSFKNDSKIDASFTQQKIKTLCQQMEAFEVFEAFKQSPITIKIDLETTEDLDNLLTFIQHIHHPALKVKVKNLNLLGEPDLMRHFWNVVNHSTLKELTLKRKRNNFGSITFKSEDKKISTFVELCRGIETSPLLKIDLLLSGLYFIDEMKLFNALKNNFNIIEFSNVEGKDRYKDFQQEGTFRIDPALYLIRNYILYMIKNNIDRLNNDNHSIIQPVSLVEFRHVLINSADEFKESLEAIDKAEFCHAIAKVDYLMRKQKFDNGIVESLLEISSSSSYFSHARGHLFELLYNGYCNEGKPIQQAFVDALPYCLNDEIQFISFSRSNQFQLLIDGILFAAIGLKEIENLNNLSSDNRILLLQYFLLKQIENYLPSSSINPNVMYKDKLDGLKQRLKKMPVIELIENLKDQKVISAITEAWKKVNEVTENGERLSDDNIKLLVIATNKLGTPPEEKKTLTSIF